MTPIHVNVLIVGAGLSGIGAAHHLQEAFPSRSYAILEAREAIGGTAYRRRTVPRETLGHV